MRAAACVVAGALIACGRLSFEPTAQPADATTMVDAPQCAAPFITLAGAPHRYLFESSPVPWQAALDACALYGTGHELALPTSDGERMSLAVEAASILESRWWLGGTDVATEGTWLDIRGNPITYQAWASGEPNNFGDEDCLDLLVLASEGTARYRRFDDRTCTSPYPYICQCSL